MKSKVIGLFVFIMIGSAALSILLCGLCFSSVENIHKTPLELTPIDAFGYYNRGNDYFSKDDCDKAIADFSKAIELQPDFAQAYVNRGGCLAKQGKYDKALVDLNKAIEMAPKFPEVWKAYRNRAFVYKQQGVLWQAIADFTKVIELNPDDCCSFNFRAGLYKELGQDDKAIADYTLFIERSIKLKQGVYSAYLVRGVMYYTVNDYDKAIEDFKKSIAYKADYDYPRIWILLASRKISDETYKKNADEIIRDLTANPSNEWARTITKYYLGVDGFTEGALLAEAQNGKDKENIAGRLCEA